MEDQQLSNLLSPSRARIVHLLKRDGAAAVDRIARVLELAPTTVRQHLDRLGDKGLVETESVVDGPGRPTLVYSLSAAGDRLFPSQDGFLFGEMIEFLVHQGYPGVVDAFFREIWERRRREFIEEVEAAGVDDLQGRLGLVEAFLERQGFVPEIEVDEKAVTIRECHCPFSQGVRATRLPCRLEAQFLEQALQKKLRRAGYMPDGHPACVYEFCLDESIESGAGGEAQGEERE